MIVARHWVDSTDLPGLRLHLRARGDDLARPPVLLVHGATYASPLYDLGVPDRSWLAALAEAGFAAYALDVRGYGRSVMPETPDRPFARMDEAGPDIGDAMAWIAERHGRTPALIGGSWGSITTAAWAAGGGRAAALVLYAPIFAARNQGWIDLLSKGGRLRDWGPTRRVTLEGTRARWDAEIPEGADWREEAVLRDLWAQSLADQGHAPDAAAFEAPNGTFLDLWDAMNGRALYDPGKVRCPTLLLRGGADPTSTRADATALLDRLAAPERRYVEIANGAHFVSAERRAPQVFAASIAFLRDFHRRSYL
ncbi:MAG: alpha/beta hydrolase [Pseudomonadota bacterium]